MIWIAKGVSRSFARDVVARTAAQGGRAVVRAIGGTTAEIWVRESDKDMVGQIIMSFWNDGKGAQNER